MIDNDDIKNVVNELVELADSLDQKLNEISKLIHSSQEFFKGSFEQDYLNKFNTISLDFPIVKNKIIGYADSLNKFIPQESININKEV